MVIYNIKYMFKCRYIYEYSVGSLFGDPNNIFISKVAAFDLKHAYPILLLQAVNLFYLSKNINTQYYEIQINQFCQFITVAPRDRFAQFFLLF